MERGNDNKRIYIVPTYCEYFQHCLWRAKDRALLIVCGGLRRDWAINGRLVENFIISGKHDDVASDPVKLLIATLFRKVNNVSLVAEGATITAVTACDLQPVAAPDGGIANGAHDLTVLPIIKL